MQPSLDIKPFMSFPVDSSSAVGLFPNFNTVSKRIFIMCPPLFPLWLGNWYGLFLECNFWPCMVILLSCIMEDNVSAMGISPNNSQHINFTNISTDRFSLFALNNFDKLFRGVWIHIISGMLFTCSRTQFRAMRHIDFSLLLQRKKVYALSRWVYFYLGDILDKHSYTNRIFIWSLLWIMRIWLY